MGRRPSQKVRSTQGLSPTPMRCTSLGVGCRRGAVKEKEQLVRIETLNIMSEGNLTLNDHHTAHEGSCAGNFSDQLFERDVLT